MKNIPLTVNKLQQKVSLHFLVAQGAWNNISKVYQYWSITKGLIFDIKETIAHAKM